MLEQIELLATLEDLPLLLANLSRAALSTLSLARSSSMNPLTISGRISFSGFFKGRAFFTNGRER